MRNTLLLYGKEMMEMSRSYKLLWVPVVFILLGVMQPVVMYYLPELLAASGDVSAELASTIAVPSASEVMAQVLNQYNTMGILLVVVAGMNIVAGERYSGTAALILVRKVTSTQFIVAKWLGHITLIVISYALSYLAAWYYSSVMLGSLAWGMTLQAGAIFLCWILLAASIVLLFSTVLKGGAAALASILLLVVLSMSYSLLPSWFSWSPARLAADAMGLLSGTGSTNLIGPLLVTVLTILFCVAGASYIMRNQAIQDQP
ncbi:ABC transporter permease subunit [Paenibacillus sp. D2_2]|uniref:ABC transporter permease n=1 Tax=Paenibacillus sp. D2_2 TaxID=3073092 RepID=UPI0028158A48|nr:ABC transporter permease subunit [Paenibacillus sp. D2_2]WMT40330.1 ABC transporter permease subunit [Paenibacillus sp. D2_2]